MPEKAEIARLTGFLNLVIFDFFETNFVRLFQGIDGGEKVREKSHNILMISVTLQSSFVCDKRGGLF